MLCKPPRWTHTNRRPLRDAVVSEWADDCFDDDDELTTDWPEMPPPLVPATPQPPQHHVHHVHQRRSHPAHQQSGCGRGKKRARGYGFRRQRPLASPSAPVPFQVSEQRRTSVNWRTAASSAGVRPPASRAVSPPRTLRTSWAGRPAQSRSPPWDLPGPSSHVGSSAACSPSLALGVSLSSSAAGSAVVSASGLAMGSTAGSAVGSAVGGRVRDSAGLILFDDTGERVLASRRKVTIGCEELLNLRFDIHASLPFLRALTDDTTVEERELMLAARDINALRRRFWSYPRRQLVFISATSTVPPEPARFSSSSSCSSSTAVARGTSTLAALAAATSGEPGARRSGGPADVLEALQRGAPWRDVVCDEATVRAVEDAVQAKFEQLRAGVHVRDADGALRWVTLQQLFAEATTDYRQPPLEFPKGRPERGTHETSLQCAPREFREETTIAPDCYDLLPDMPPLCESFVGLNGRRYRYTYYVARLKPGIRCNPVVDPANEQQCNEISSLAWYLLDELAALIRPVDTARRAIVDYLRRVRSRPPSPSSGTTSPDTSSTPRSPPSPPRPEPTNVPVPTAPTQPAEVLASAVPTPTPVRAAPPAPAPVPALAAVPTSAPVPASLALAVGKEGGGGAMQQRGGSEPGSSAGTKVQVADESKVAPKDTSSEPAVSVATRLPVMARTAPRGVWATRMQRHAETRGPWAMVAARPVVAAC